MTGKPGGVMDELSIWLGITFCVSQSAMFSGLNLAVFSLDRLNLEVDVQSGSKAAERILKLCQYFAFRGDEKLCGNVGIELLLSLLPRGNAERKKRRKSL